MSIKELIEKKGKFSKAEIDFVIEEGRKFGIMPPKRTTCQNCWRDMAIEIAYAMRDSERKGRRLKGSAARNGVVWRGLVITNDTLTDEMLDYMTKNGFPQELLTDED